MHEQTPLVEVRHCVMEFPGVRALDDVSFTLLPGECHALVGENGAGKSTLVKCIIGENAMTSGELDLLGEPVSLHGYGVRDSQQRGVAVVHQEFQLMEDMTGIENIYIGRYAKKGPLIDWKTLRKKAGEVMAFLESDVNLNIPVKYLRTAEKQIVQLAKALAFDARIIILDELTAVLQDKEIQNIFRIIHSLKDQGIGIIYVSHRLDEVFQVCDSYTVLCDGRYVSSGRVAEVDKDGLVEMIIGRELNKVYPEVGQPGQDMLLELRDLTAAKGFRNINLQLRAGEVVGIAGLVGAGKTELLNAIFGAHKVTGGEILLKGKPVHIRSPRDAIRHRIGLVPDERKMLGLNMLYDVKDNTVLPSLRRFRKTWGLLDHRAAMRAAYDFCERLKLNYRSLWQNVGKLSGGNQQKIVIAKWMLADSEIFLLDEPTRGIDIGAKVEIYKLIADLTAKGCGVILVSPELEELIGLSHRVYILFEGEIKDVVEGERKTQPVIIGSLLGVDDDTEEPDFGEPRAGTAAAAGPVG